VVAADSLEPGGWPPELSGYAETQAWAEKNCSMPGGGDGWSLAPDLVFTI